MAVRGAKRKPRHLKVERGTLQPVRDHGHERSSGDPVPDPPDELGEEATWFWFWLRSELAKLGLGESGDYVDFLRMARLYERAQEADRQVGKHGMWFTCSRTQNPKRHPAAIESERCWRELRIGMEAIGVTLAGRTRHAQPRPPEETGDDPYQRPS